jgi:flagellin
MISIQTNVASLMAQQNLDATSLFQQNTIEQLTSGYRINQSGDDAAGLAVANKFRSDTAELTQGVQNANDGIGQLQIIDGGLSNISQILDRLKTLATQSASSTFTGDRSTLNNEFQADLQEVDRQAANIGLVSGGVNNTNMSVYTGGGSDQANAQVSVDLSGAANQVDSNGLGIGQANVLGGGTSLTGNTQRLDAPGATFLSSNGAAGSQTFTFNVFNNGAAQTISATVKGVNTTTNANGGLTATQAVTQLNSQLSQYGISASIGDDGTLQFGGGTAFTLEAVGGASAGTGIATAASTATNTGVYDVEGATSWAAGDVSESGGVTGEILTFQNGQGSTNVTLDASKVTTAQGAVAAINAQTSSLGIYAVLNSAGTGISFQSSSDFSVASDSTDAATFGAEATAGVAQTVTGPGATGSATANALAAITSIENAVAHLGLVQGRVGSGENRLQYAVNLAQSQITNYTAAESNIRDTDVAAQAANLTKAQTLSQAAMAAMAQANSSPQNVLTLLKG